jgi:predicted GNAT family acetyltransferase
MEPENDMTDHELEEFEQATRVIEDKFDRLELLRQSLNKSRTEMMYGLKRGTKLGPLCPYYLKARRLFEQEQQAELLNQIRAILAEFEATDER